MSVTYCGTNESSEEIGKMSNFRERLADVIEKLGFSKWGIGDISGLHPLADEFPKALSVALVFKPSFAEYDEAAYHAQSTGVREETEAKVQELVAFFKENKVKFYTIPAALQNPETLHAEFPHKLAGTRAGLGWIGKCDLLITPEFGPRVRLGTILFDADVKTDAPVNESSCGDCIACTSACPASVVHNTLWSPGKEREELISALGCSRYRDTADPSLGRKHSCGLCLLACPHGRPSKI